MKLYKQINGFVLAAMLACAVCWGNLSVFASELTLEDPLVADDQVSIPVTITTDGSDQPASLQFDLTYDDTNFAVLSVQVGDSAALAGKSAVFSENVSGTLTVVVAGLNQNVIPDGVVANVTLCPLNQVADTYALGLDAVVVSDPFGNPIDIYYEGPPSPENVPDSGDDDDMVDEETFASEDALPEEQTEEYIAHSAEMNPLEGSVTETTGAAGNEASGKDDPTPSAAETRRQGLVMMAKPEGAVSNREMSGAGTGDDSRVLLKESADGFSGRADDDRLETYQRYAGDGSASRLSHRVTDGSRTTAASSPDSGNVSAKTQPSNEQQHAIGQNDTSGTGRYNRRAVTGYVIALAIAGIAVVARIIVVR